MWSDQMRTCRLGKMDHLNFFPQKTCSQNDSLWKNVFLVLESSGESRVTSNSTKPIRWHHMIYRQFSQPWPTFSSPKLCPVGRRDSLWGQKVQSHISSQHLILCSVPPPPHSSSPHTHGGGCCRVLSPDSRPWYPVSCCTLLCNREKLFSERCCCPTSNIIAGETVTWKAKNAVAPVSVKV